MDDEQRRVAGTFNIFDYLEGVGGCMPDLPQYHTCDRCVGSIQSKPREPSLQGIEAHPHFGLTFSGSDSKTDLIGWSDTDWAQDLDSRLSIGAFVFGCLAGQSLKAKYNRRWVRLMSTIRSCMMHSSNSRQS
jgi:hypothetical protein